MPTEILTAVAPGLIYRKSLGTSANSKQKYVSVYETIDPLNNNKKYKKKDTRLSRSYGVNA